MAQEPQAATKQAEESTWPRQPLVFGFRRKAQGTRVPRLSRDRAPLHLAGRSLTSEAQLWDSPGTGRRQRGRSPQAAPPTQGLCAWTEGGLHPKGSPSWLLHTYLRYPWARFGHGIREMGKLIRLGSTDLAESPQNI